MMPHGEDGRLVHEFTWTWTREDYLKAFHLIRRQAGGSPLARWLPQLLAAVLLLLLVVPLLRQPDHMLDAFLAALPWLIIVAMWIVLLFVWLPRYSAGKVEREDPAVRQPIRHLLSDAGFGIRTASASMDFRWDTIRRAVETPEFFLFYYSSNCAYFTPRRAIPEADLPSVRDLLARALGERARLEVTPMVAPVPGP